MTPPRKRRPRIYGREPEPLPASVERALTRAEWRHWREEGFDIVEYVRRIQRRRDA